MFQMTSTYQTVPPTTLPVYYPVLDTFQKQNSMPLWMLQQNSQLQRQPETSDSSENPSSPADVTSLLTAHVSDWAHSVDEEQEPPFKKQKHAYGDRKHHAISCSICGKRYKNQICLQKHQWEHHASWNYTKKLMLNKHQSVQMMEAAQVLINFSTGGSLHYRQKWLEKERRNEEISEIGSCADSAYDTDQES